MSRFLPWHNPVPDWRPSRIDQGVDGTLSDKGFRAPFKCRIVEAINYTSGWKGGWIAAEIVRGPFKGQGFYVAEGCKPLVSVGEVVRTHVEIAEPAINGYNNVWGNIECGWVAPNGGESLARTLPGYSGDQSLQAITCGCAFNRFIEQCGGVGGINYSGLTPDWSLLPSSLRAALLL